MQHTDMLATPASSLDTQDTWNQARSLTQLQAFITSKLDSNDEEISDVF